MSFSDEVLDRLAPAHAWVSDWPDVLKRAGERHHARFGTKRRLVLAFAVLAAVLVPLTALGALGTANDWWFLKFGDAPAPTKEPVVVKEGEWDGHPWQLIAYPTSDGLCVSVTPKRSTVDGYGGAMSCSPFAGTPRTSETKESPDMTITLLSGGASNELPAYIAGPVIAKASSVEIRFANGHLLRVPTFAGPDSLENVRFYATQLPPDVPTTPRQVGTFLKWVAGVDASGNVVACLAPRTAKNGPSPLADCR